MSNKNYGSAQLIFGGRNIGIKAFPRFRKCFLEYRRILQLRAHGAQYGAIGLGKQQSWFEGVVASHWTLRIS